MDVVVFLMGRAGSGTILYSSSLFLFVPLLLSEVLGPDKAVVLTTVLMLVALALANVPSVAKDVLLVEVFNFHAASFSAREASSVIV